MQSLNTKAPYEATIIILINFTTLVPVPQRHVRSEIDQSDFRAPATPPCGCRAKQLPTANGEACNRAYNPSGLREYFWRAASKAVPLLPLSSTSVAGTTWHHKRFVDQERA